MLNWENGARENSFFTFISHNFCLQMPPETFLLMSLMKVLWRKTEYFTTSSTSMFSPAMKHIWTASRGADQRHTSSGALARCFSPNWSARSQWAVQPIAPQTLILFQTEACHECTWTRHVCCRPSTWLETIRLSSSCCATRATGSQDRITSRIAASASVFEVHFPINLDKAQHTAFG